MSVTIFPCRPCNVALNLDCPNPLDSYTLQGPEFPFVVNCPPGYDCDTADSIHMVCCGQELADVFPSGATQAQRNSITQALIAKCRQFNEFCGDGVTEYFYNRPQSFQFGCPTGGTFTFTVPAGMFIAETQAEADLLASQYAQNAGIVDEFCVTAPAICPCKDSAASYVFRITGGRAPFTVAILSGFAPTGMAFSVSGRTLIFSGTPTLDGPFTFTMRVTAADGATWVNTITAHVITIATTTLTDFVQGVPYSFQLQATGGSGSYAWKITSGSLPAGLEMNLGGLITGTPTTSVPSTFTVEMIDLTCQSADRTFFPPRAQLAGHSVTTIATVKGYDEFLPSTPPKKYMVRTYTTSMSGNDASGNPVETDEGLSTYLFAETSGQLAYAFAILSGSDQINAAGTTISTAFTKLYSSCPYNPSSPIQNVQPILVDQSNPNPITASYLMPGWCFQYDISYSFTELPSPTYPTCSGCNFPLLQDNSANPLLLFKGRGINFTSTHLDNVSEGENHLGGFGLFPNTNPTFIVFPPNLAYPHLIGQSAKVKYKHAYAIDLSTEYTDALALANAQIINSNGLIASTMPRTNGFVSTWTTVTFDIRCTNLVFGEVYDVSVDFRTDTGIVTTQEYEFTATGTTHTISDSCPIPPAGHTVEVRNPKIAYGV